MSVGPTSAAGSFASTPLAQARQETDRAAQNASDQSRAVQSGLKAESAAGIGETAEEHEAAERDADGRRLWEEPPTAKSDSATEETSEPRPPDPRGECGTNLDLSG